MSTDHYWPGSMSQDEIVKRIRSWSDGPISRDEAYEVIQVASLLGVFGFPEGSQFQEEKQVREETEIADEKIVRLEQALAETLQRLEAVERRIMTEEGINELAYTFEARLVSRMKYGRNPRIERAK